VLPQRQASQTPPTGQSSNNNHRTQEPTTNSTRTSTMLRSTIQELARLGASTVPSTNQSVTSSSVTSGQNPRNEQHQEHSRSRRGQARHTTTLKVTHLTTTASRAAQDRPLEATSAAGLRRKSPGQHARLDGRRTGNDLPTTGLRGPGHHATRRALKWPVI